VGQGTVGRMVLGVTGPQLWVEDGEGCRNAGCEGASCVIGEMGGMHPWYCGR
jgi:hypothetical protein